MSERATLSRPTSPDGAVQSGVTAKAQEIKRSVLRNGLFDKKPIQRTTDRNDESRNAQEATDLAKKYYASYRAIRNDYEHGGGKTPATLADLSSVVDTLWDHIDQSPVDLLEKSKIKAELEPLRKFLRRADILDAVNQERRQEERIRPLYIQARAIKEYQKKRSGLEKGLGYKTSLFFYPFSYEEIQRFSHDVAEYLETPLSRQNSRNALLMDQEIREVAATMTKPSTAEKERAFLFTQTDTALLQLQHVLEQARSQTTGNAKDLGALENARHAFQQAIKIEEASVLTEAMRAERRGIFASYRYIGFHGYVREAYQTLLDARLSDNPEDSNKHAEFLLAKLRPGQRKVVERLVEYQLKVVIPRTHELHLQHAAYDSLRHADEPSSEQAAEEIIAKTAINLAEETLLDKDIFLYRRGEDTKRDIYTLKERWQRRLRGSFPSSVRDATVFWNSLQSQYSLSLSLLEETHRLLDGDELQETKHAAEFVLGKIEEAETICLESTLLPSKTKYLQVAHEALVSDATNISAKEHIAAVLVEIKDSLNSVADQFTGATFLFSYTDLLEKYNKLCSDFEQKFGASSPQSTLRPPRPTITDGP